MSLRVVVAEDSLLVREGIRRVLETQPDMEVVALCADLPQLLLAVAEHDPDVVLTDVRMPPMWTDEGIRAATALRGSHPSTGVVVLSQYEVGRRVRGAALTSAGDPLVARGARDLRVVALDGEVGNSTYAAESTLGAQGTPPRSSMRWVSP